MCCVMPPASPFATAVDRSLSNKVVLPWSTWPMMVTIGGRRGSVEGLGLVELGNFSLVEDLIDVEHQCARWVYVESSLIINDWITTKFHRNQTCVLGGQN